MLMLFHHGMVSTSGPWTYAGLPMSPMDHTIPTKSTHLPTAKGERLGVDSPGTSSLWAEMLECPKKLPTSDQRWNSGMVRFSELHQLCGASFRPLFTKPQNYYYTNCR